MKRLSKAQILILHDQLLAETGGAPGIRDEGLLDSALDSQDAGFGGYELYSTVISKAARLAFGLVRNHPFTDGNKRTGVLAMLVTLAGNGLVIEASDTNLIELGIGLARGDLQTDDVVFWIIQHQVQLPEPKNTE